MEPGLRTPLLDSFRRPDVARDVRLAAAQGQLAPRAEEQAALLMLLARDTDAEVAATAENTLRSIPQASLQALLARTDLAADVREFLAGRGLSAAAGSLPEGPLVDTSTVESDGEAEAPPEGKERPSVLQKIQALNVAGRMALAMKGSREERSILIRDPNKLVSTSVLSSPKINETEVESIAKMANVSEEILRLVASSRAWTKSYAIVHALVRNPKTPVAISMNLMVRLTDKDLRMLSTNRNVPEILRVTARKKVVIQK